MYLDGKRANIKHRFFMYCFKKHDTQLYIPQNFVISDITQLSKLM